jgi:hypothetical protein
MVGVTHPWFTLDIVVAISLFATVTALAVQYFVGTSPASIVLGPVLLAAMTVIVLSKLRPSK